VTDPYIAEIRIFPFNFAPRGWALCNGQLLPISQNTALFSLLGTNFGGNGISTFGLPNFQGSAPVHRGQGPGLSDRGIGESGGVDAVTLISTEMPVHGHGLRAHGADFGDVNAPSSAVVLAKSQGGPIYSTATDQNLVNAAPNAISPAGGNQPHNNLPPYLTLTFCIALQGVFPPRG